MDFLFEVFVLQGYQIILYLKDSILCFIVINPNDLKIYLKMLKDPEVKDLPMPFKKVEQIAKNISDALNPQYQDSIKILIDGNGKKLTMQNSPSFGSQIIKLDDYTIDLEHSETVPSIIIFEMVKKLNEKNIQQSVQLLPQGSLCLNVISPNSFSMNSPPKNDEI